MLSSVLAHSAEASGIELCHEQIGIRLLQFCEWRTAFGTDESPPQPVLFLVEREQNIAHLLQGDSRQEAPPASFDGQHQQPFAAQLGGGQRTAVGRGVPRFRHRTRRLDQSPRLPNFSGAVPDKVEAGAEHERRTKVDEQRHRYVRWFRYGKGVRNRSHRLHGVDYPFRAAWRRKRAQPQRVGGCERPPLERVADIHEAPFVGPEPLATKPPPVSPPGLPGGSAEDERLNRGVDRSFRIARDRVLPDRSPSRLALSPPDPRLKKRAGGTTAMPPSWTRSGGRFNRRYLLTVARCRYPAAIDEQANKLSLRSQQVMT